MCVGNRGAKVQHSTLQQSIPIYLRQGGYVFIDDSLFVSRIMGKKLLGQYSQNSMVNKQLDYDNPNHVALGSEIGLRLGTDT